jgi:hypothetical protein
VVRFWTTFELERLEVLRRGGAPLADVAAALGRTPKAVEAAVYRNGLTKYRGGAPKAARRWRWRAVLCQPHTTAGAARDMGVTPKTVRQARRRLRRRGCRVYTPPRHASREG